MQITLDLNLIPEDQAALARTLGCDQAELANHSRP